jgi:hypothetical protein
MSVGQYSVCTPARAALGFGEHEAALRVATMRDGEPGDAGAGNCNSHLRRSPPRRPQLLATE